MLLSCSYERQTNAYASVFDVYSQPVHIASPAIRCSDQRADDRAVGVYNKQTACVMGEQSLHIIEMIGHGGVPAASLPP